MTAQAEEPARDMEVTLPSLRLSEITLAISSVAAFARGAIVVAGAVFFGGKQTLPGRDSNGFPWNRGAKDDRNANGTEEVRAFMP